MALTSPLTVLPVTRTAFRTSTFFTAFTFMLAFMFFVLFVGVVTVAVGVAVMFALPIARWP